MTEREREALMRLTMCARNECVMCKYKDSCDSDVRFEFATKHMNILADALRKTESNSEKPNNSTISKMEQVEQRSCDTCKNRDIEGWKNPCLGCTGFIFYEPKDEPQTEPLHTCSVNGRPYSECSSCEHFKCTADEPQTDCAWR